MQSSSLASPLPIALPILFTDIEIRIPELTKPLFRIKKYEIPYGQKLLIHGQSGKGKSTLLHLIAGLHQPTTGKVTIGNFNLSDMSDAQLARFRSENCALVFQRINLMEHLTSLENLLLVRSQNVTRARATEILKKLGLLDRADTRSGLLSLGEQQRVAIGRALMSQAPIILADEPTSSLDQDNSDNVIDTLIEAAKDKTLVVVSHDRRLKEKFSNVIDFNEMIRR